MKPRKGLMLPSRFSLNGIVVFLFFSLLVYKQLLWCTFYPLAVKAHSIIIIPSLSRRVHYSLMQLDQVLSLCRCAFIIVIHTHTHTHAHAHTHAHTRVRAHTHTPAYTLNIVFNINFKFTFHILMMDQLQQVLLFA